jgi:hypothetical protein
MAGKMQSVRDDVPVPTIPEQQLQERAYRIWHSAGQPDGHDLEHWTQAFNELLLEHNAATTEIARAPVPVAL